MRFANGIWALFFALRIAAASGEKKLREWLDKVPPLGMRFPELRRHLQHVRQQIARIERRLQNDIGSQQIEGKRNEIAQPDLLRDTQAHFLRRQIGQSLAAQRVARAGDVRAEMIVAPIDSLKLLDRHGLVMGRNKHAQRCHTRPFAANDPTRWRAYCGSDTTSASIARTIAALYGSLPPEVEALLRTRTLMHLSVVLGELAHNFSRLDPRRKQTREHLDELAGMIGDIPPHRLDDAICAGVMLEAGVLSGLVFRLCGFQPRQEVAALIDATIYLHALERGYTVLTRNIRNFDFMNQIVPPGRVLLYRT